MKCSLIELCNISAKTPLSNLFVIEETIDYYEVPQLDPEKFVGVKLKKMGFKVKKSTEGLNYQELKKIKGKPDFTCLTKNGREFYVEAKSTKDSWQIDQILWVVKHPQSLVFLYILRHQNGAKPIDNITHDILFQLKNNKPPTIEEIIWLEIQKYKIDNSIDFKQPNSITKDQLINRLPKSINYSQIHKALSILITQNKIRCEYNKIIFIK